MVHEIIKNKKSAYVCNVCSLSYSDRTVAEQCEEYCTTYGACSLEITKHAIEMQRNEAG
jgi:hypothetical protein